MKNVITSIGVLLLFINLTSAQNSTGTKSTALTAGATLLFTHIKTKLTATEKNTIFKTLELQLSPDKKSFVSAEVPVDVTVYPTDMNKDGQEEIFVVLSSVQLFGHAGQTFFVYIKNKKGTYTQHGDTGPGSPVILSTKNLGYPDILVGGPGFTFPVYKWNGSDYIYARKMKDAAITNKNSTDIAAYSKRYTDAQK